MIAPRVPIAYCIAVKVPHNVFCLDASPLKPIRGIPTREILAEGNRRINSLARLVFCFSLGQERRRGVEERGKGETRGALTKLNSGCGDERLKSLITQCRSTNLRLYIFA